MTGARRAAGERARRIPADPAVSAVGRLLDPRGVAADAGDEDALSAGAECRGAGSRASVRGRPRARRRRQGRDPFVLEPVREDPRHGGDGERRPPGGRQRGRGRSQGGRRPRRTHDRPPQRQARHQAQIRSRPAAARRSIRRGSTAAGSIRSGTIAPASICRIIAACWRGRPPEIGENWAPDARHPPACPPGAAPVRGAAAQARECCAASPTGIDLDLDALVRARCDLRAGGGPRRPGPRRHAAAGPRPRGHAAGRCFALDGCLGRRHRVLDVEKRRCSFWLTDCRPAATTTAS